MTSQGPKGLPSRRSRLQRLVFRRQFYPQLLRIARDRLFARDRDERVFVSMMGGVGDLVNLFPSLEHLAARHRIDMGTGRDPYLALVRNNPHVRAIYSPFVYQPSRRWHRTVIARTLSPFYARVILLDSFDGTWWARGRHISEVYAEACGCPAPPKGAVYLSDADRQQAADYLKRGGLTDFVYASQSIRHRRPFRSWPLAHHHRLYRMLHDRFKLPILVDATGSDEAAIPDFCRSAGSLDVLVAAAVIERARLFVGPDSGLTHVAAALGARTVSIHLGFPPESCRALGENVLLVGQARPFDDPAGTSPEAVFEAIERFGV